MRLAILFIFACFQWRLGIGEILFPSFFLIGNLNVLFAVINRCKLLGSELNYWDEAMFFLAMSLFVKILSRQFG